MRTDELEKFKAWLTQQGAEVLPITNPYEMLRFKGRQVGVIYTSGKYSGPYVNEAIKAFKNHTKWKGVPIKTKRKSYLKQKEQLLDRDGDKCFFCGKPMGEDITLEHLIALSAGGPNTLSNSVLAHEDCNNEVGNIPIYQKVEIAIKKRKDNESIPGGTKTQTSFFIQRLHNYCRKQKDRLMETYRKIRRRRGNR